MPVTSEPIESVTRLFKVSVVGAIVVFAARVSTARRPGVRERTVEVPAGIVCSAEPVTDTALHVAILVLPASCAEPLADRLQQAQVVVVAAQRRSPRSESVRPDRGLCPTFFAYIC